MEGLFPESAPLITRVTPDAASPKWSNVVVGRRRVARVPAGAVADLGIRVGAAWTPGLSATAAQAAAVFRAKLRAVSLLEARARSKAQLRERLLKAGFEQSVVEESLSQLSGQGLVNDAEFAREKAGGAIGRGFSRAAAAQLVRRTGIGDEQTRAALQQAVGGASEFDRAVTEARNREAKLPASLDALGRFRRLHGALGRLGYPEEVVREAVEHVLGRVPVDED